MRKTEIELMIDELEALLKYEEVLKNKEDSKSKVSVERLRKRMEEWQKVSKEYDEMKEEILEEICELRKLFMKKLEVFEEYYQKFGAEA